MSPHFLPFPPFFLTYFSSSFFSGSFSSVYMCTNRYLDEADSYLAIKTIDTKSLTATQIKSIIYEINILSQLQNQSGIVKLHSVFNHRSVIYMVSTVFVFLVVLSLCQFLTLSPPFSLFLSLALSIRIFISSHLLSLCFFLYFFLSFSLSLFIYFSP